MKDSTVLLQKRWAQQQADRDKDTLQMYKVARHAEPGPTGALCWLKMSCVSFVVRSPCAAGVPPLALWDAAGGFASRSFLLNMPHVPSAAVFARTDLHLQLGCVVQTVLNLIDQ